MTYTFIRLDRNLPVPLHFQLAECLRNAIDSGMLEPCEQLPTVGQVVQGFGVSQAVVRQAYAELAKDGLIETIPGKGTFVCEPRTMNNAMVNLVDFFTNMKARGIAPGSQVLEQQIVTVDEALALRSGLEPGQECLYLKRLRLGDGQPVFLMHNYTPLSLYPGIANHDFTCESLYQLMKNEYGRPVVHMKRRIKTRLPSQEEQQLLQLTAMTPCFVTYSIGRDASDHIIEYSKYVSRGDRDAFEIDLDVGTTEKKHIDM